MKITKIISFLLLCASIFFFGCDKGNKTDYPEDDDTDTVSDIDSDTANDDADTPGNETDEDQTPVSDSDIDNNPTDEPHPHDDADSEPDDTDDDADSEPDDTDDDADSEPDDTDDDADSDDADSISDNDIDNDADTEQGDNDSIQEADEPAVICTGQTKCFNNIAEMTSCPVSPDKKFFGQDAQYAEKGYCLDKSLDATADLVTDNITGLIWQRNLPSTYSGCSGSGGVLCSHSEAVSYCNNLTYGGYSDWRLPTPKEFGTIIDYGETNPALDSEKFPDTPGNLFWTSTIYDYEKNWAVNFLKGEITPNKTTSAQSSLYVRCVRGETLADTSFAVLGSEEKIVKDSVNNLIWTKSFGDYSTWKDSLAYCKNLEYADLTEWRLPNINELKTLINYSRSKPASDFEGMVSTSFWSSTSYSSDATNAWAADMTSGTVQTQSKDNEFKVICVK